MPSTSRPSATSRPPTPVHDGAPLELTRFIGRDTALTELRERMETGRLLTLTGAGGSGKTRLALELLRRVAQDADVEIVTVELAGLADAALLPRHVAEAFGIHEEVRGERPASLVDLLAGREAVLLLDNCEHLVDACAALVEALLRGCAGLRILATSREALGVTGERAWLVPPLTLPQPDAEADAIAETEAVRLFVDRARDTVPGFGVTAQNASVIAEICRRLDGIPLAIELAAARVKVLAPEQIRDRLDDAFALLRSSSRTAIPRHRTLRAAIDWSYDLLPDDARALFRRLAVFRGGFPLDAVEFAGDAADAADDDGLDRLERLVDRSLVAVREQGGEARYALLETVRQYAAARLAEAGEEDAARRRHAQWVEARVAEAEPHFTRTDRRAWVDRLLPELENIREALRWSADHEPALHVRLVGRLWWFWYSTRHWTEAQRWIESALDLPQARADDAERATLLFAAGALAALQTRVGDAERCLLEAIELAGRSGAARLEAYALNYLGMTYSQAGDPRGAACSARAKAWFREANDLYGLRLALLIEGTASLAAGDTDLAEARNLEGVDVARRFGQDRELAIALGNAATVYVHHGDPDRAEPLLREALYALRRDPGYLFIGRTLDLYAEVLAARGQPVQAARLMAAADAIRESVGARAFKLDQDRRDRIIPALREAAGDAAFERAWREGARLQPDSVLADLLDDVPQLRDRRRQDRRTAPATDSAPNEPAAADVGDAMLDVRALGPFEVRVEGRVLPPDAWPYAKPRELLLLLLLHRAGRTRDQIGGALWPAATPAQAKNRFHVTLHHLRRALGHTEWIVVDGDRYRLAPDLAVAFDADRFDTDARAALRDPAPAVPRLRALLALDRGDLLEGETAGWIEEHRARLRRLSADLSLCLGRALEQAGDAAGAEAVYRSVLARDELDEEAHRRLMVGFARGGARTEAIRHFERLSALLRETLDAEPDPETVAVYERIRGGEAV